MNCRFSDSEVRREIPRCENWNDPPRTSPARHSKSHPAQPHDWAECSELLGHRIRMKKLEDYFPTLRIVSTPACANSDAAGGFKAVQ
jgi:hypothetical protein